MAEKSYTEAEVAALLGHAVQLQHTRGANADAPTLTLAEVKAAAAEAGIDTRYVDLAAASGREQEQTYFGLPVARERSVTVAHALTDAEWQQMVGVFVRTFGGPGEASGTGAQRRWTRGGVTITADVLGDQTMVHAEARRSAELPVVVLGVASIATIMIGGVALAGLEWTIGVAALLLTLLVGTGYARARNSARQQLDDTDARMQTALNQCAALMLDPPPLLSSEAKPTRLDAGLLSEEASTSAEAQPQIRRTRV
ncbi:MAG: hypothetical protein AAF730_04340 [Bacteroidota bacterium]